MKQFLAVALMAIMGGANFFMGGIAVQESTYSDDGMSPYAASTVRVNYENKDENEYRMVLKHPNYTESVGLGDCACTAGANIIGYFDRYDENLIPNHTSGFVFQGQFIYNSASDAVTEVVRQLYNDMGTDDDGTTVREFTNGMIAYCNRMGKSISFTSVMKNKKFDYALAKAFMEYNQPIVLFCGGYNVADIYTDENTDSIYYYESTGNHVMVGFGYRETSYELSSSGSAFYQYITVASGYPFKSNGYYDIDYKTNIDDAYAINIY